jgi:next-to-BRCA1 protein 1
MATPGHHVGNNASPDTPITIKISVNDSLKKLKLPLKDLGANVLIDKVSQPDTLHLVLPKGLYALAYITCNHHHIIHFSQPLTRSPQLRHCLNIKPEQHAVFERFSDSAGGYIILESNNPQVFKTLIRAAKAKSKLRLKATVTPDLTEQKPEEVASSEDIPAMSAEKAVEPVIVRSPDNQTSSRDSTALDGRSIGSGIFQFREARASQQTLVEPEAPVPQPFTADRSDFFNAIANAALQAPRELAFRSREPAVTPVAPAQGQWSVYCNSCDAAMYNAHYHCSICDGGDYDLCEHCISSGTLCPGEGHWLIKRCIEDGKVVTSTTERICRKAEKEIKKEIPGAFAEETKTLAEEPRMPTRTCNNCVYVLPEDQFVTCKTCEDFDLCVPCHRANKHGHHPAHGFTTATDNVYLSVNEEAALAPGRHVRHNAICDGCDKTIYGIRHKCLDCPDWDYCSACVAHAPLKHSRHRFAAIYNPIAEAQPVFTRHAGIYCDGPLCKNKAVPSYIMGTRFKCAVCHDTDFCASCEALPGNHHNRTHPLIKFKTPVKNVSITTMNEDARGHVRNMGDKNIGSSLQSPPFVPKSSANAPSEVKTVAEFKPEIKQEIKQEAKELTRPIPVVESLPKTELLSSLKLKTPATLLSAAFVSDSIPDGMAVAPGARFTQIWTLKNDGAYPWPAGCSVRYTGGDNMLNVDNGHPASVTDINEATESNVIGREVQVGESTAFKVVLKAPLREGKAISYWRVKAADGTPFGHRLWCDIQVKVPVPQTSVPQMPPMFKILSQQEIDQQRELLQQQRQQMMQQQIMQQQQAQQLQQRQSQQSYLASQQRLQMINQQREAAMQREMARHGYQGHSGNNNNANFSHPAQQQAFQQPSASTPVDHTVRKENANKEGAKLRVEQIKAKITKQRAEKFKSEAKAARAAADKKSAEEDAKVKKIIEAVTKIEDEEAEETEDLDTSQMVFPKLEKESPAASIIQSSSGSSKGKAAYVEDEEAENTTTVVPVETAPSVSSPHTVALGDDFDDFDDLEVLSADEVESNDGFLTDEEYDILDASDQETVVSK